MPLGAFRLNSLGKLSASVGRTKILSTVIGNGQLSTAQAKFGNASYLSDGNGDGIVANNPSPSSAFLFSGNYTYECWVYKSATPANTKAIMGQAAQYTGSQVMVHMNTSNQIIVYVGGSIRITSSATIANNTWTHVAVTKSSGVHRLFVGGTLQASTYTDSAAVTGGTDFHIGREPSAGSWAWAGHIDELRVSNIARYTSTFTPATSAFTNDANTVLLYHFEGEPGSTAFIDDAGSLRTARTITTTNSPTISTAQSKFGGSSLLLTSASSQYLTSSTGASLTDYTVELWYRATTLPGSGLTPFLNFGNTLFYIGYSGANTVYDVFSGGSNRVSLIPVTINTGTWYHVAFVRSGSSITVYHNGTSVTTGTWSTAVNWDAATLDIGRYSTYYWNGHFDEIRISNTSRYTGNFTAPTARFTNDANTLMLLHFDGSNGSTTFIDDNS